MGIIIINTHLRDKPEAVMSAQAGMTNWEFSEINKEYY